MADIKKELIQLIDQVDSAALPVELRIDLAKTKLFLRQPECIIDIKDEKNRLAIAGFIDLLEKKLKSARLEHPHTPKKRSP
ncbi:hypothetical protein [Aquicella lusitana]|uniref:Uncharacterized protein n=1 Tax=Aquicella lusitana TaxID=254246 RepID=A0A370GH63_9COXI|nr:hypothetical protein [Aquicella lusitana]RDI42690.1 hypothetical protein C8D86_11319 [Aquicella lusitana]VVC73455.1 hypothetical protein AQULUS_11950 [Aquicella lusitana]